MQENWEVKMSEGIERLGMMKLEQNKVQIGNQKKGIDVEVETELGSDVQDYISSSEVFQWRKLDQKQTWIVPFYKLLQLLY